MNENIKYLLAKTASFLPDKVFCSITFLLKQKRFPNLKNPVFFNDKLLYLKLTKRDPILTKLVDKYEVRKYVSEKIGPEYLVPLIGLYENPEEVDFDKLPNKFVLKPTSGSQRNIICRDKKSLNWSLHKKEIYKSLKLDPYMRTREWPYKDVPPRFVIEEYIEDSEGNTYDYKFWCFNGEPKFVQVDVDRFENHKRTIFNIDFTPTDIWNEHKKIDFPLKKPKNYKKMIEIARALSSNFPFVRVDLYNIDGKIYFGEMTFYPGNCNERIRPIKYEKIFGDILDISRW